MICNDHLSENKYPKILEIGVDKGQTAAPLIQNLASRFEKFLYVGVDIMIRQEVIEQLSQFNNIDGLWRDFAVDNLLGRDIVLHQENSLSWLTKNQNFNPKFDVVLLDGDHNYFTVFNELTLLQTLVKPTSIIVCDDYTGRWAEKDLWYSAKEEYKFTSAATPIQDTERKGVMNAVNDFVATSGIWDGFDIQGFEPMILFRKGFYEVQAGNKMNGSMARDMKFPLTTCEEKNGTNRNKTI